MRDPVSASSDRHPCIMIWKVSLLIGEEVDSVIMLTIYVDDLIVAASGNAEFIWSEDKFRSKFEYTTQGRLKYILFGCRVHVVR